LRGNIKKEDVVYEKSYVKNDETSGVTIEEVPYEKKL
jgi:hypothetical protein